jgi:hypothetical protein
LAQGAVVDGNAGQHAVIDMDAAEGRERSGVGSST